MYQNKNKHCYNKLSVHIQLVSCVWDKGSFTAIGYVIKININRYKVYTS